jgi:hypothetical protein
MNADKANGNNKAPWLPPIRAKNSDVTFTKCIRRVSYIRLLYTTLLFRVP